jgi:hypothetical protein
MRPSLVQNLDYIAGAVKLQPKLENFSSKAGSPANIARQSNQLLRWWHWLVEGRVEVAWLLRINFKAIYDGTSLLK